MTAQTNQPAKFLVPFAQNDSSRVELPVTTSDATRASQSLGFPPATMQPPEAGGVPPQGEDFNGALNQIARIAWWMMLGGRFSFDGVFAAATQIGGYPKGALLLGADALGEWINTTDNNTANPDTTTDPTGAGYVPGYQYGVTAFTGLAGGTMTLTNAQAAKRVITLAGTLTSALTIIVPTWQTGWTVFNNTTGAFAATIKTAGGSGVAIPQNGLGTRVRGDGTNIVQDGANVVPATQNTQPVTLAQALQRFSASIGTAQRLQGSSSGGVASVSASWSFLENIAEDANGNTWKVTNFAGTCTLTSIGVNGMDTGAAPVNGTVAIYAIFNTTAGTAATLATNATATPATERYTGAFMPAGYTASVLISIITTNGSGQFNAFTQVGRKVGTPGVTVLNTSSGSTGTTFTAIAIPANARYISGQLAITNTAASVMQLSIYDSDSFTGLQTKLDTLTAGETRLASYHRVSLLTPQRVRWAGNSTAGTPTYQITVTSYEF